MLTQKVTQIIIDHHLCRLGDTVIVGFSGGPDSTALLHLLKACSLNLDLKAVYIDHGLRPEETVNELRFTKNFAAKLGVEYVSQEVDVRAFKKGYGHSLEEAARIMRYNALQTICAQHNAQAIAVAHTADDQVEEFFIRLIRGTGCKGLSGMLYKTSNIIRPLLSLPKNNLLDYLKQNQIDYCYDSSNDSRSFLRNRIRLDLLPELEKSYNPAIRTTILQTTEILRQEDNLLEEITTNLFSKICTITEAHGGEDHRPFSILLNREEFIHTHSSLQRRVLEKICWKMENRPAFRQLHQLQTLATQGKNGSKMHLANGLRVRLTKETVVFAYPAGKQQLRGDGAIPAAVSREISLPGTYYFREISKQLTILRTACKEIMNLPPDTLIISDNQITFPLTVRPALPGEKMRPLGAPGQKDIADL